MPQAELIQSLASIRTVIRRRLVAYGICAVLAGGVVSFLTVVALDWLLGLPWALRLFVASLFIAGFFGASWHWIVKPLRARLGLEEIAAKLEKHFPALGDSLASAVSFAQGGDPGSPRMVEEVIAGTEQLVRGLPLRSALSLEPLLLRMAWLAFGGLVLLGLLSAAPSWVHTGVLRYVNPRGKAEWPRTVSIDPLTADVTAAVGESVTVRMRVQHGWKEGLRGVVYLKEPGGETAALTMNRFDDGTYYATIDTVTQDLRYWFEAGDDTTKAEHSTIRVVARPEVVEAVATVEPPPYASQRPVAQQELADGPVSATIGGFVRIDLHVSKVIDGGDALSAAGLRTDTGELIRLVPSPTSPLNAGNTNHPHALTTRFEVVGDISFRPELRDRDGFENRGAPTYSIRAVPDQPPSLQVLEPQAVTEVTPQARVRLVIRVMDDFGVNDLTLHAERGSGDLAATIPLTDRLRLTYTPAGAEGTLDYSWDLKPLSVKPGDALVCTLTATDNYTAENVTGQTASSSPVRVKIISAAELETRLRADMAVLETRIRQMSLEQADLLDDTQSLLQSALPEGSFTQAHRAQAGSVAAEQSRLLRPLRDIAQRIAQWGGRLELNEVGEGELREKMAALERDLKSVAAGAMNRSVRSLNEAAEHQAAVQSQELARAAAEAQEQALMELQAIIRSLAQWSSFQGLITRSQDLLDRQDRLRSRTTDVGRELLGKPVDSLTAEEISDLKRVRREQDQLKDDVRQLLQNMAQSRAASTGKDQAADEAIDAALRAARAHDLNKRLEAAAEAIGANRTAAATIEQKAAAEGVRKMIAALREREDRDLDQLRKKLGAAEEQLALLIEEQQDLLRATQEAVTTTGDSPVYGSLANEQRRLRNNGLSLGRELADVERTASIGQSVTEAAAPMQTAESRLQERNAADAALFQDEALAILTRAVEELRQLAQETADQAIRRSLAQIREELEAVREAQGEVNDGIGRLKTDIDGAGRVGRAQTREATRLSMAQSDVRAMIGEMLPDLEKVIVYRWALDRVSAWMDLSKNFLDARRVDDELLATTARIIRELDKLIGAISETEALPFITEFEESDSGSGGAGQNMETKSVPTVAELLVLKKLQVDINDRTHSFAEEFDSEQATESQLRGLKEAGDDQAEVRRLADLVINRARQR